MFLTIDLIISSLDKTLESLLNTYSLAFSTLMVFELHIPVP